MPVQWSTLLGGVPLPTVTTSAYPFHVTLPLVGPPISPASHSVFFNIGNVEKSRQRRSRPFAVLTYYEYAPRVKMAAALLDRPFGKTQGMLF